MTDAYVHPGDVTPRPGTDPTLNTIVGPSAQWSDASDATYAQVSGGTDANGNSVLGAVQAPVPTAGFIPDNCLDVQMWVRAAANTDSPTGQAVQIGVWDDVVGSQIGSIGLVSHLVDGTFTTDGALIADGTIHEYLYRWSDVDSGGNHSFELIDINTGSATWDPPSFASWIHTHPGTIVASLLQHGWLTYYEMTLILIGAGTGGIVQTYVARQRLHPIAPARRWPREAWLGSSSRRVGGYR